MIRLGGQRCYSGRLFILADRASSRMEKGRILLISGIAILPTGIVGTGVILLLSSLDIINNPFGSEEIAKPEWNVGDHWTYDFRTPDLDGVRGSKIN